MNTPAEVYPQSQTYLTIYWIGITGTLLYNVGSGILQAIGDAIRPFYFLAIAAITNTVLDLVSVIVFHMEIARATTMKELQQVLPTIPSDCFAYHCNRNDFSRWLRAQGLFELASKIRNINIDNQNDAEKTQKLITETIRNYRTERAKGVISLFSRSNYDETLFFSRIGSGSLGGKGRGLAFIDKELRASGLIQKYPQIYLSIPRTVVISTDQFSQFIEQNHLQDTITEDLSDTQLVKLFLSYPMLPVSSLTNRTYSAWIPLSLNSALNFSTVCCGPYSAGTPPHNLINTGFLEALDVALSFAP